MTDQLAYSPKQAAATLGFSLSHFTRHIRPDLKPVFVGNRIVFRRSDLERWLAKQ